MYMTPGLLGFVLVVCAVGCLGTAGSRRFGLGLPLGFGGLALIIFEAYDWLKKFNLV